LLRPLTAGDLTLNHYTFAKGEGLPLHDHDEATAHVTIVAKGSVTISGPSIETQTLVAGNVYDFPARSPHEIIALEDGTVIVNIPKRFGGARGT
jgi:quercetin dioxygenase-like cupin family protein